jgi:hypothetical protein
VFIMHHRTLRILTLFCKISPRKLHLQDSIFQNCLHDSRFPNFCPDPPKMAHTFGVRILPPPKIMPLLAKDMEGHTRKMKDLEEHKLLPFIHVYNSLRWSCKQILHIL